ncbi:MAG TPA: hypothetical protein VEB22_06720, partial [Phycisphaerales bacterium]|nr:hypothetical protein [Phycisphaerales bacterium]
MDNFSDRLYVSVYGKPATSIITWQSQNGTVTFSAATGWKSWSGRYELIDRCAPPNPCTLGLLGALNPSDGVGRWIVRTTDSSAPRQMWAFEEFGYTSYGGAAYVYKLGRLRRRALLTSDLSNVAGRYNYTVDWATNGT